MREGNVWINLDFVRDAQPKEMKIRMLAFDIASLLYLGGRTFAWDPTEISDRLWLRAHKAELLAFFVETGDGFYPSASWFSEGSGEAVDG